MQGLLDHNSLQLESSLDDEVRAALREVERPVSYSDGELIYSQGDDASHLLIVRSGSVRVGRTTADGREMTLAVLGPGHVVGLVGMMVGHRGQDVVANGATHAGLVTRAAFDTVLKNHPSLASQLLPVVLSRLKAALNFIDDVKRLPVAVHTAAILEQLLHASHDDRVIEWSQAEIALAVGSSRVSVGKALKELEKKGLIELKYARVEVPDAVRLTAWVNERRAELLTLV